MSTEPLTVLILIIIVGLMIPLPYYNIMERREKKIVQRMLFAALFLAILAFIINIVPEQGNLL